MCPEKTRATRKRISDRGRGCRAVGDNGHASPAKEAEDQGTGRLGTAPGVSGVLQIGALQGHADVIRQAIGCTRSTAVIQSQAATAADREAPAGPAEPARAADVDRAGARHADGRERNIREHIDDAAGTRRERAGRQGHRPAQIQRAAGGKQRRRRAPGLRHDGAAEIDDASGLRIDSRRRERGGRGDGSSARSDDAADANIYGARAIDIDGSA